MNLYKAIELIIHAQSDLQSSCTHDLFKAILLCLQAAKRIQHTRVGHSRDEINLLPGETED